MSTEETYIRITFPTGPLTEKPLTEKTVQAEFGPLSPLHLELAILLMFEHALGLSGEDAREIIVESLEGAVAKLKSGKGKTALQLFKEMIDE
jgi:hypothetical protein